MLTNTDLRNNSTVRFAAFDLLMDVQNLIETISYDIAKELDGNRDPFYVDRYGNTLIRIMVEFLTQCEASGKESLKGVIDFAQIEEFRIKYFLGIDSNGDREMIIGDNYLWLRNPTEAEMTALDRAGMKVENPARQQREVNAFLPFAASLAPDQRRKIREAIDAVEPATPTPASEEDAFAWMYSQLNSKQREAVREVIDFMNKRNEEQSVENKPE